MPSVYRPKNENILRTKVGYHLNSEGKRVRTEFRLGDDPIIAHKKALVLGEKWLKEEERHVATLAVMTEVFPIDPTSLPVWTGMPDVEAEFRQYYLSLPPDDVPDDHGEVQGNPSPTVPTIKGETVDQRVKDFLERQRRSAHRDQNSPGTCIWYEHEFRLGFVKPAIDTMLDARSLMSLSTIEKFIEYWSDLRARANESPRGHFGWRAACNRIDALNALLHDMEGRVDGFVYPVGANKLISKAKESMGGNLTAIWKYDADVLRSVIQAGDDRHRMFVYLFMNFGMYQADVGQQIQRRCEPTFGGFTEIDGERYLQWWRHKLRRRRRQLIRTAKSGEETPILLTHYVWPEVWSLLERFAAPEANVHNKWLLNEEGQPLWRHSPTGKSRTDNISTAYYRALRKKKLRLPIDQIRKFGATACEALANRETQELYRGERRSGSSRVYVLGDYIAKLTPFLKKWGDQLRADGVLY